MLFPIRVLNLPLTAIDPSLIQQVFMNIIMNAVEAMNGNGTLTLITRKDSTDGYIEIDFTDNGKGIDLKRRKDIFRPGYSTKRRGWGLGLSLSKRIIEVYHKGKIFVKSSVIGEGTTFKIILKKS